MKENRYFRNIALTGVVGLALSYYNGIATGPAIILVLAALFFGTFLLRKK